jgi:hypothetical protein
MYSNNNQQGGYNNQNPMVYNQVNNNQHQGNNNNFNNNQNVYNNQNQGNYNNNMQNNYNMNNNPNMNNNQIIYQQQGGGLLVCLDPMAQLAESVQCFIRQQYCLFEMLTGCDTKNVYDVYTKNQYGQITFLFRCKEESSCCARMFCKPNSRPLKMHMKHVQNLMIGDPSLIPDFAFFDKPFTFTFFCCGRPYMDGFYGSSNKLGKINFPFTCCSCDPYYETERSDGSRGFKIRGTCCQCGLWCGCCKDAKFGIFKSDCDDMDEQNQVGSVIKKRGDMLTEMFTNVDNFEVTFPPLASPEDKLLLIGSTIMLDYMYFEQETDNNNN